MYGQMTAGSWIYIGHRELCRELMKPMQPIANKHFNGTLKGTLNVTAGLGGMGGAQPLAITMNEGVALIAEVEKWRIEKRIETKYLMKYDLKILMKQLIVHWKQNKMAKQFPLVYLCNAVHLLERLIERNIVPDTLNRSDICT